MKALFSFVGVLLVFQLQAQKIDCSLKVKEYQSFIHESKWNEAYNSWNVVRNNCPKENENLYTEGLQILNFKIDNESNPEAKELAVRDALKLYDQYAINYPLAIPNYQAIKAMLLVSNKMGTPEEIFSLLDSCWIKNTTTISDALTIYTYFNLYYQKYNTDSKIVNADMLLDKYMHIIVTLNTLEITNPAQINEYEAAERNCHNLIKELLTCDYLSAYFEKNFGAQKENAVWLSSALSTFTVKCGGLPMYYAISEANYKAKKTSKSAYYFGVACTKIRKFEEAIQYFIEAEELETNPAEKAKLDYSLATGLLSSDKSKAKALVIKAASLDPKMGKAYIYLAELYANSAEECSTSDLEKKTIYYLAAETLKKAVAMEPRLKITAEKMAEKYSSKILTDKDIVSQKLNGKTVKIGCWINDSVTFPAKK